ncbi:MAG: hypothetical protein RMM58_06770 [Chloroflexota bacterium]|nr:hypothetical protein [Dehalococcoidia bacterium]MDW8253564.1 hypothetical protein [Chloroflexota bacterium]
MIDKHRARLVFAAAAHGSLTAFVMTHGLFLHLIPLLSPLLLIGAPIIGGMRARGRARLGLGGAIVVAFCITIANVFPYLLVVPLVLANQHLFSSPATAAQVTSFFLWLVGGFVVYSMVAALIGILVRHLRPPKVPVTPELVLTKPHLVSEQELWVGDRRLAAEPSALRSAVAHHADPYPAYARHN